MGVKIYQSFYKNIECLAMESEQLLVKIIPESGSKIQSIYDKRLKKEYRYQSQNKKYTWSAYDTNFGVGDTSGFDEVFPSIEECFYPLMPWKGTRIPDHGEVWAIPWNYEIKENHIYLEVNGTRFPYKLEKRIEFLRDNCLRITYKVKNPSCFDFNFSWVPHPLFNSDPYTRIIFPKSVKKVMSTCSVDNKLGKFGEIHEWPVTEVDGDLYDISKVYPKYAGKCEKYYAAGKMDEGWCALHNTLSGSTVGISYPVDKVPYLGVWEGIMNGVYVTALEPCTAALDYLDTAIQWNQVSVVKAGSEYEWYLNLTFDTVKEINGIDEIGLIK